MRKFRSCGLKYFILLQWFIKSDSHIVFAFCVTHRILPPLLGPPLMALLEKSIDFKKCINWTMTVFVFIREHDYIVSECSATIQAKHINRHSRYVPVIRWRYISPLTFCKFDITEGCTLDWYRQYMYQIQYSKNLHAYLATSLSFRRIAMSVCIIVMINSNVP